MLYAPLMMKATLVVLNEPDFLQNGYMFAELRRQLAAHDIDLATQDLHPPEQSVMILGLDVVDFFQSYQRRPGQQIYLLLNEPATYYPKVWDKANHAVFDRVFTFDYTLADGEKYIHHYFAIDLDSYPPFREVTEAEFDRRKLLVLMAGMFQFTPPILGSNSLLYTRYQTLRWFGQHLPQQFDFYSRGIDPAAYRSFRGLGILQRVLPQFVTSWLADIVASSRRLTVEALNRGPVPALEKLTVIRSYRFVICYENTSTPGYISEKLFDCLFSGCVPIYLGEPDIQRFIPKECFIDRQLFATNAELAAFLIRMTYVEYASYLTAIRQFVGGIERQKFGSEANAKRIADVLLADLAISVDN
jgi:hypothetical protein